MQQNDVDEIVEIDLGELFKSIVKKWWIILFFVIFSATAAAVVSYEFITLVYKAETSLFIGKEKEKLGSISLSELQAGSQLVTDYTEIIKSNLCTEEVINTLQLNITIEDFLKRVTVTTIKNSRLFKIAFESTDPRMAADVANEMAQVIIKKAEEIIEVNNVKVIDVARVPIKAEKPNTKKNTAVAAALGFVLAVGLIFLMEMLDNTFKKPDDIERQLGLNLIGMVPRFSGEKRSAGKKEAKDDKLIKIGGMSKNIITLHDPRSAAAEAYRAIRTNLSYSSIDGQIKTIVITSPGVAEGKSTSTCNIAVSLAQNGQKVLLIDADLRKPKIQQYFGIISNAGLTEILTGKGEFETYVSSIKDVEGLDILTSGAIPPNPTELLSTHKMKSLIKTLSEKYDILIIDTPPVAELTDAAILGTLADGVLLVVSSGETKIEMAKKAQKVLGNVSARILGVVMAKVERQGRDKYYYYYGNENVKA